MNNLAGANKVCSSLLKNHQKLAFLYNICCGTVVLASNSAKVKHCRQKVRRMFNNADNHQIMVLINNFCFGHLVLAINSAEEQYGREKNKKK